MEIGPKSNSENYSATTSTGSDQIIVVPPTLKIEGITLRLAAVKVCLGREPIAYNYPGPVFINPNRSTLTITLRGQASQETYFATFKQNKSRITLVYEKTAEIDPRPI